MRTAFSLAPGIDADRLAKELARSGRVTIEPFLGPGEAESLHALLSGRSDWLQVFNCGDQMFELDRATQQSLTDEQRRNLDAAIYGRARRHFQFRYRTTRVPDEADARAAADDLLADFACFLSTGAARELFRRITGERGIAFADAQATAYASGDFLTAHDDAVEGKNRIAAYVLGLTPAWRVEWGGLFLMHGRDGATAEALVPGFNRLNLFRVPRLHSVSEVTRAAPFRRYSITGWLRR